MPRTSLGFSVTQRARSLTTQKSRILPCPAVHVWSAPGTCHVVPPSSEARPDSVTSGGVALKSAATANGSPRNLKAAPISIARLLLASVSPPDSKYAEQTAKSSPRR